MSTTMRTTLQTVPESLPVTDSHTTTATTQSITQSESKSQSHATAAPIKTRSSSSKVSSYYAIFLQLIQISLHFFLFVLLSWWWWFMNQLYTCFEPSHVLYSSVSFFLFHSILSTMFIMKKKLFGSVVLRYK